MGDSLPTMFDDAFFGSMASPDDIFNILDRLEDGSATLDSFINGGTDSTCPGSIPPSPKRARTSLDSTGEGGGGSGERASSHITVERKRRKQMNEHLAVLRSLMPCFYVKRGDQASIIGGVIDYIKELQQVLHSLEVKKQRKAYSEVVTLSPRTTLSSPRLPQLSPKLSPLSPRLLSLPVSPRTPQSGSPYKARVSSLSSSPSIDSVITFTPPRLPLLRDLVESSKAKNVGVEVKFSGPYLVVKTTSSQIRGQAMKMVEVIEGLSLEVLHVSVSTVEETMLNSFTIKVGIDCQLSAEELAQEIQLTFT